MLQPTQVIQDIERKRVKCQELENGKQNETKLIKSTELMEAEKQQAKWKTSKVSEEKE